MCERYCRSAFVGTDYAFYFSGADASGNLTVRRYALGSDFRTYQYGKGHSP